MHSFETNTDFRQYSERQHFGILRMFHWHSRLDAVICYFIYFKLSLLYRPRNIMAILETWK